MMVTLIGMGCGTAATMTVEGRAALLRADALLGAQRLLDVLPEDCTQTRIAAVKPKALLEALVDGNFTSPCVLFSGDTGFYSGTRNLLALLEERGIEARVLPGISSVQLLAARLGRPWQDWTLCSAHGTECYAVAAVTKGQPAFFLTGGTLGPSALCRQLTEAGLGQLAVTVGENLAYENETITRGCAEELANRSFAPLSVMLAEGVAVSRRTPGIPDGDFLREKIPMTKQEVRAAVLAKLAIAPGDTIWDVGAGTGSVSVELALAAPKGRVFGVECVPEACALIRRNREKFGAWNLTVVEGTAPEALEGLPAPDAVFLGGSRGRLEPIVTAILEKNPKARICVSAIALETLSAAVAALTAQGLAVEVCQISISRTRPAGKLHLLTANNPVFLITRTEGENP